MTDLALIPWAEAAPPVEATLRARLEREGFSVFAWTDAPGARYAPHAHDRDESIWVVAGEIVFTAAGRTVRLGPGDRLLLPAGTVHTAEAGPAGATYLVGEAR
jgi:quercetin dioxygenase-like cupin family protein